MRAIRHFKSLYSVSDQLLFAGSAFLTQIIFVRYLGLRDYGELSLAISVSVLADALIRPIATEPMLVFGANKKTINFNKYISSCIFFFTILSSVFSFIILMAYLLLPLFGKGWDTLLVLSISYPAIGIFWVLRMACYAKGKPEISSVCSLAHGILLVPAVIWLGHSGSLTPSTALAALASVSILASALCIFLLGIPIWIFSSRDARLFRRVINVHWNYGKWLQFGSIGYWVTNVGYIPLTSQIVGLEAAGTVRAIQNLFLPLGHFFNGIYFFILPRLSGRLKILDQATIKSDVSKTAILFGASSIIYLTTISYFNDFIFTTVYSRSIDEFYKFVVYIIASLFFFDAIKRALSLFLAATRKTRWLMLSRCTGIAVMIVVSWPSTMMFGLHGVVFSMLLSEIFTVLALAYFMSRLIGDDQVPPLSQTNTR